MKRVLILIVGLILFGVHSGITQMEQVRFDYITSKDGLSENVVNCIFQDSQGFMWFGTDDGLNRYDGYNFTTFKPDPTRANSINSNIIFALTEDHYGKIWIGTTGSGLNRYDPLKATFTEYRSKSHGLSHDHIVSLLTDSKGRVWAGTFNGLNLIIPNQTTEENPIIIPIKVEGVSSSFTIHKIFEDAKGIIWLASREGLFKGTPSNKEASKYDFQRLAIGNMQSPAVRIVQQDPSGKLLLGSFFGIYAQVRQGFDVDFQQISDIPSQHTILFDDAGKMWVGSNNGLLCYRPTNELRPYRLDMAFTAQENDPFSLNYNVINCIYRDRTGIIWIGTDGGGINKFDPNRKQFFHFGKNFIKNGNRFKKIRSALEDSEGKLWMGTEGGGLFVETPDNGKHFYNAFESIGNSRNVFALCEVWEADEKYIYVGSEDTPALQKIKLNAPDNIEVVPNIRGSVFTIYQDRNHILWIGTYNRGLYRWIPKEEGGFDISRFTVESDQSKGLKSNIIRKIYEDRKGNIWIGTSNGLSLISATQTLEKHPEILTFQNIKGDSASLSHNYIFDIYENTLGELWIGTFGGGLNKLVEIKNKEIPTFIRYAERDGLPNNSIKAIQEDDQGNLWIASNTGLSRYNSKTDGFQNFTTYDGLQENEFLEGASFKKRDGELLFGGVNGFNVFTPAHIQYDDTAPVVTFTKFIVHNQEVHPAQKLNGKVILDKAINYTEAITLKYHQNDFSVEFSALHYAAPKNNQYAYKLEGYHDDWIEVEANKRSCTFTNLPHGKYTLLVKASNPDKLWMNTPTVLSIRIKPPFWLTWYAYVFYFILLIAALWAFQRYTVISTQEKHRLVFEHIEREKLEELNQMKLRFFTNISHELRTPLTLIIAPLEYIFERGKHVSIDKLQQQHHYMYKNAKYLLRLVNQLLDFRKLDEGSLNLRVGQNDILGFVKETTAPFQFFASKKDIQFSVESTEAHIYTLFDPDIIEKVIYNLLSNAFKFTQAGGIIIIRVLEKEINSKNGVEPFVELRVEDNGPGIPRSKVKKIFERFYKESSKKENKDGAGIGLAYTKNLVELHHGLIKVETVKGQGAHFIVQLPSSKKAYLKSELFQAPLKGYQSTADPLDYLVVEPSNELALLNTEVVIEEQEEELPLLLFIDDNPDIRRFLKEGFKNDFRIIEAEDGEKGMEIALSSLPDIIVSDIMMPNISGIELCEILKSNPLTSHIPIVLLTAKSTEDDELEGLKIGADAYVMKPFKLDTLRTQLLNIHMLRERLKQKFRKEIIMQPEDIAVTSVDEAFLKKAMSIIEEHMSDAEFNVEALVKEMHISRSKLYLKLKALTGQSSSEFIRTIRLKRAVQLLEKSDYTIKEIMYMTGFNTASYFSKCFKNQFGVVPSEYIKKQQYS